MKKFLSVILAMSMILTLVACGNKEGGAPEPAPEGNEAAFEPMNLKMSIPVPDTSNWMTACQKFADDIASDTNGAVKITVYANSQLSGGNQQKGVEMLMSGATDLDMCSAAVFSNIDKRFSVLSLPFLFDSIEKARTVLDGAGGDALREILAENGIHLLSFGENGMRQLTNNGKQVKTAADMAGLKIRVMGSQMLMDAFAAMGANPISMNGSEIFTSLQQGTIDGQENPEDIIRSFAFHEVQDYMTEWNYSYDAAFISINKELFDSMSPELQEIFTKRGLEVGEYQRNLAAEQNTKSVEEIKAAGVEVYYPTAEDLQTFKEKVQPVVDNYAEQFGSEFMAAFK